MDGMNDLNASVLDADARRYVFAVVFRILRNEDAAADVTQDALLLAHRYRSQFRGEAAHRTWLHRIAVTSALQHLRKQRRSREQLVAGDATQTWEMPDPRPTPEQEVASRQVQAQVRRALEDVKPAYREVVELRAMDYSEPEIAQRLGISVANVKIRAFRTRNKLREVLGEHALDDRAVAA